MKKMKLVLLAAMIIGIGSAFTTKTQTTDSWVKDRFGNAITLQAGLDDGGYCNSNIPDVSCVYEDEALTTPAEGSDAGRFVYP